MANLLILITLTLPLAFGEDPVKKYKFEDGVLFKLHPSWRECYMQYGMPIDQLNDLLPYSLQRKSDPYCLCETWWPRNNPTQTWLHAGTPSTGEWKDAGDPQQTCVSDDDALISKCDSFDESKLCQGKVWVGLGPDHSEYGTGVGDTVLRCIKDVPGPDAKSDPKYPVQVYDVDSFDIGYRCNKSRIIEILNDRLEIYRQNSQFYWQIAMSFANVSDLSEACDQRLFTEGFYLKVYFKCLTQLPDMTDNARHSNPEYRSRPESTDWLTPDSAVSCYYLLGEPLQYFRLREANGIPTKSNKLCVCEEGWDLVVKDNSKCPHYDLHVCEEDDEEAADDCQMGDKPIGDDKCIPIPMRRDTNGNYIGKSYCTPVTGVLNFSQPHRIKLSCEKSNYHVQGWCPGESVWEKINEKGCIYKSGNFGDGKEDGMDYEEVRWRGDSRFRKSVLKLCDPNTGPNWFENKLYINRAGAFMARVNTEHYRSIPAVIPDDWYGICPLAFDEAECTKIFQADFNHLSESMYCKPQNFAAMYRYTCVAD